MLLDGDLHAVGDLAHEPRAERVDALNLHLAGQVDVLLDLNARQLDDVPGVLLVIVRCAFGGFRCVALLDSDVLDDLAYMGERRAVRIGVQRRVGFHQLHDLVHDVGRNDVAGVGGGHGVGGALLCGRLAEQVGAAHAVVRGRHLAQPCVAVLRAGRVVGARFGVCGGNVDLHGGTSVDERAHGCAALLDAGSCGLGAAVDLVGDLACALLVLRQRFLVGAVGVVGDAGKHGAQFVGVSLLKRHAREERPKFVPEVHFVVSFAIIAFSCIALRRRRSSCAFFFPSITPFAKERAEIAVASLAGMETAETS